MFRFKGFPEPYDQIAARMGYSSRSVVNSANWASDANQMSASIQRMGKDVNPTLLCLCGEWLHLWVVQDEPA